MLTGLIVSSSYANTDDARIAERLKPAASVCVEGDECKGVHVAGAAAPAASAGRSGEEIFNTTCTACHSTGAAGAPIVGNSEQWKKHIAKGMDTLHKHAIEGFNAMPAKGTCMSCSDEEIMATVDYMVGRSK